MENRIFRRASCEPLFAQKEQILFQNNFCLLGGGRARGLKYWFAHLSSHISQK